MHNCPPSQQSCGRGILDYPSSVSKSVCPFTLSNFQTFGQILSDSPQRWGHFSVTRTQFFFFNFEIQALHFLSHNPRCLPSHFYLPGFLCTCFSSVYMVGLIREKFPWHLAVKWRGLLAKIWSPSKPTDSQPRTYVATPGLEMIDCTLWTEGGKKIVNTNSWITLKKLIGKSDGKPEKTWNFPRKAGNGPLYPPVLNAVISNPNQLLSMLGHDNIFDHILFATPLT